MCSSLFIPADRYDVQGTLALKEGDEMQLTDMVRRRVRIGVLLGAIAAIVAILLIFIVLPPILHPTCIFCGVNAPLNAPQPTYGP
jgi:Mg/Co/Ni transporter MgtE